MSRTLQMLVNNTKVVILQPDKLTLREWFHGSQNNCYMQIAVKNIKAVILIHIKK